jgi:uncharacterized membrane protein
MLLGPIGMGILLNVDSPYMEDDALYNYIEKSPVEVHGTRTAPSQTPLFVDLHFRGGSIMNTTASGSSNPDIAPTIPGGTVTFDLQKELVEDFFIENPSPGFPMVANVYLSGNGDVSVNVRDGAGGTVIGTVDHSFTYGGTPTSIGLDIPFSSGANYTFSSGHIIEIEFAFTSTGRIHFDSTQAPSRLTLYGNTIPDITVNTANFNGEPVNRFYPNDIEFPQEINRKEVQISGKISEVFGKENRIQYVSTVEVDIHTPGGSIIPRTCDYDKNTFEYSYTWTYPFGQEDGEYTIVTRVIDEQSNEFTVNGSFNMSEYGILLTSPDQDPEEGTYRAPSRKNLVEGTFTTYEINVHNIGNSMTSVDIGTIGQGGWDWWIDGENLSVNNNKSGKIDDIPAALSKGFKFMVDSMGNSVGSPPTTNIVTVSSTQEPTESSAMTTISTVVLQYDIEMEFMDGTKTKDNIVETGNSIDYVFTVSNEGGKDDTVNIVLSSVPAGWAVALTGPDVKGSPGQYRVDLVSGDSTEVTLTVDTPSGGDEETVAIEITGRSKGSDEQGDNPVESDKLTTTTTTTKGIKLIVDDLVEQDVDPGGDISFKLELTNTGTSLANITATFSGPGFSDGWNSNDISFAPSGFENNKQFLNLAPDNPQTFWVYVEPSEEVLAGNYSITITVENNDASSRTDQKTVYCIVNEIYKIEIVDPISLEIFAEAEPGDDVEFIITIENNGNVVERVNILVDKPRKWGVDFGNASDEWTQEIEPSESETINIVMSVPDDAQGDETVDITISIVPVVSDQIQVETHTEIKQIWYQPLLTLLVPLLLFIVIIVMVVVIYKRR